LFFPINFPIKNPTNSQAFVFERGGQQNLFLQTIFESEIFFDPFDLNRMKLSSPNFCF